MCVPVSYHLRIQKFMQQVARTAVPGSGDTTGSEQTLETWIQDHFGYLAAISKKSLRLDKAYPTRKNTCFASNIIWLPLPSNRQKKQWLIESVIVAQAWSTIVPGLRSSGSLHLISFNNWFLWTKNLPIPPFVYFVFVGLFLLFFFLFLIHSFMCSSIIYLFGCRLYLSAICHYYCM